MSVVIEPMSRSTTPRSRSSGWRAASPAASGASTSDSTVIPARFTACSSRSRLHWRQETRWTKDWMFVPVQPVGSVVASRSSTQNSWGRAWSRTKGGCSQPAPSRRGIAISTARRTSPRVIGRPASRTVTEPEELIVRRLRQPTETSASPTSTPAACSISSTAARTAAVAPSGFTISPCWTALCTGACPMASTSRGSGPSAASGGGAAGVRARTARIESDPISSPQMSSLGWFIGLGRPPGRGWEEGAGRRAAAAAGRGSGRRSG